MKHNKEKTVIISNFQLALNLSFAIEKTQTNKQNLIINQMKKTTCFYLLSIFAYFLFVFTSCKKDEPDLPVVTTIEANNITTSTAICGGEITSDGGGEIKERGVCWSTSDNPTIADSITTDGKVIGKYSSRMSGLSAGTIYYVRAYATNEAGTAYGNSISFITKFAAPQVATTTIPTGTASLLESGGNITSDGGLEITARGVCWGTTSDPTIEKDYSISDGNEIGTYKSQIKGLLGNTTYYIRAYATNIEGTGYGNTLCFVTDADGNVYHPVTIGTQVWLVENLKTTHYRNGDPISNVTDDTEWSNLTTGAYCSYNNQDSLAAIYGQLYNWYAVTDSRKLTPSGWHVPTDAEWTTLENYLGGINIAGGKLKESGTTHWGSPNTGATNESGFCALPGGQRVTPWYTTGIGGAAFFWTSTETSTESAYWRYLASDKASIDNKGNYYKVAGFSVRCLKD